MDNEVNVFKVELLIIDFDRCGEKGIVSALEDARYPNRCISPKVMKMEGRQVLFNDNHPLNSSKTDTQEYEKLFGKG